VTEEVFQSRIAIQESPQRVSIAPNRSQSIPLLLENIGTDDLENVTAEIQGGEDIDITTSDVISSLSVNSTGSITLNVTSPDSFTGKQNVTVVVSTSEGARSFTTIQLESEPTEEGFVPKEFRVPVVATGWTVVLLLYAVLTKRYNLNSTYIKVPFLLLILGEVTLMLFVASKYYGFTSPLLPF
jgi:hypothetical protein